MHPVNTVEITKEKCIPTPYTQIVCMPKREPQIHPKPLLHPNQEEIRSLTAKKSNSEKNKIPRLKYKPQLKQSSFKSNSDRNNEETVNLQTERG